MLRLFFIACCVLLLHSCTKEAKVKLPEAKPLPVIYSYICPSDTVIRLKLMLSSPLFSPNQINVLDPVSDADVKISSAQGTAQLIYDNNTGYYELKTNAYPIVPGQIYKVTVTTINGDVATAETQVPIASVPINTVSLETIIENYQTSDLIKVSFTDETGRLNYYRIAARYAYATTFQPDTLGDDTRINELYSDVNHDGENASVVGRFYLGYDSNVSFSAEYYDVYLYNCSESYYRFYKSLKNDQGTGISFPPPGEPSFMYTNVKGGFGCFAAYTSSVFRYKKK